jgi:hypothetical protein
MSAYPLPTEGCACATCEWLRGWINERGVMKNSGVTVNPLVLSEKAFQAELQRWLAGSSPKENPE